MQAQKFGARLEVARQAKAIRCERRPFGVELSDGETVNARSVVVATGARYRKLDVADYARYEGQGIHYAATAMEAQLCGGLPVVVVGGGNSAGQAAVYLARSAAHVHLLVRGKDLGATMSDYLVQRIASSPRITVHAFCEICELGGDDYLRSVAWRCTRDGARTEHAIQNLFVMIGAEPNTAWLEGCVELDDDGFVCQIALRMTEEVAGDDRNALDERVYTRARALLLHGPPKVRVAAAVFLARASKERADRAVREVLVAVALEELRSGDGEDEAAAIELCGDLGLAAARPGLERRAFSRLVLRRDRLAWHARVALARMGHERASREILSELGSWDRDRRTLAVAAAGRARLEAARPLISAMRGDAARADPGAVDEALASFAEAGAP